MFKRCITYRKGKHVLISMIIFFSTYSCFASSFVDTVEFDRFHTLQDREENKNQVSLLLDLAKEYADVDPQKSFDYTKYALKLVKSTDFLFLSKCYHSMHLYYETIDEDYLAKQYVWKSIEYGRKAGDDEAIAFGYCCLGNHYSNNGAVDSASVYYQHALTSFDASTHPILYTNVLLEVGRLYHENAQYHEALDHFLKAHVLTAHSSSDDLKSLIQYNIATSYHEWRHLQEAQKYYLNALDHYRASDQFYQSALILRSLGDISRDQENFHQAVEYYTQCYEIGQKNQSKDLICFGALGLGEVYLYQKHYERAVNYLQKSLKIAQQLRLKGEEAYALFLFGKYCFFRTNTIGIAKRYCAQSSRLAKNRGNVPLMVKISELQSQIYAAENNYQKAYKYHLLYNSLKDSIFSQDGALIISKFHAERTNREKELRNLADVYESTTTKLHSNIQVMKLMIVVLILTLSVVVLLVLNIASHHRAQVHLKETNKQFERKNIALNESNSFKNKLLSVIGHDLKSSVGSINGMLKQMVKKPEMFPTEIDRAMKRELYSLSENTYDLLENLLLWAKNQRNTKPNFETFELDTVLHANRKLFKFFAAKKEVTFDIHCNTYNKVFADRNQINMIIRNLLSNALKFTPNGGRVSVRTTEKDNQLHIHVKDTGVGIAEENIQEILDTSKYYTTYGTANEKGSGLGLILCQEFIERNNGTLAISSTIGEGSTFTISIPKKMDNE